MKKTFAKKLAAVCAAALMLGAAAVPVAAASAPVQTVSASCPYSACNGSKSAHLHGNYAAKAVTHRSTHHGGCRR